METPRADVGPITAHDIIFACGWADAFNDDRVGCVIVDATSGLVVAWNRCLANLLATTSTQVGLSLESIVPERYREAHRRGLARYGETGRLISFPDEVPLPAVHASGDEIRIQVRPAIGETGGRRYAMATIKAE